MRDVIVVAVIAMFFALGVAYVRWCDRIIGPDPDDLRDHDRDDHDLALDGRDADPTTSAGALQPAFDAEAAVRS